MKKTLTLVALAVLLLAPNAMAQFATGAPATTDNDDSCDISTAPAATVLVPYFEVDIANPDPTTAVNTLWTLVNTSPYPQIAHVTIWTDWSFPVIDFNIFLTGYDVQGVSMYTLLRSPQTTGSGVPATSITSTPGTRSALNTGNVNFAAGAASACTNLPGNIPEPLLGDVRNALTTGLYPTFCGSTRVGGIHSNAIGYITVDVANTCSTTLPSDPAYYSGEILFDNVLTGDVIRVNPTATSGNYAGGSPLVHIRAIPEGGPAGVDPGTNLPFTFYDRYTPAANRDQDRRQPLPGTFAARYIQGGVGSGNFNTDYAIWREGTASSPGAACTVTANSAIRAEEIVRWDEHENPFAAAGGQPFSPVIGPAGLSLPEVSSPSTADGIFPAHPTTAGDVAGWMYLNLNVGAPVAAFGPNRAVSTSSHFGRSQNWVTVQMTAEGRFGVDFDATWLGNGCSAFVGLSSPSRPAAGSGPPGATGTTGGPAGPSPNDVPPLGL